MGGFQQKSSLAKRTDIILPQETQSLPEQTEWRILTASVLKVSGFSLKPASLAGMFCRLSLPTYECLCMSPLKIASTVSSGQRNSTPCLKFASWSDCLSACPKLFHGGIEVEDGMEVDIWPSLDQIPGNQKQPWVWPKKQKVILGTTQWEKDWAALHDF